jgi:hypothetical protein
MRIFDNGVYRDATEKEIAEWERLPPPDSDPITDEDKAEAYDILTGVSE